MKPILQVEDDPNDVILLHHALKNAGIENPVLVANDGREAIDYLQGAGKFGDRKKFPLPYLVLLDLKLPYVMGLDVLKWIRQQMGMEIVVIMLTASAEEVDIKTAYRLGANAFLTKPSEASKLEDMLKALKDFWLTHNTLPRESFAGPAPRFVDSRTTIFGPLPSNNGNGISREEQFTKKAVNE
ncbi:MAG TPA: response regulator [Verrucomicrobiae bacterium]|nr:response regulator [Verrucomicrobiae bacterium]